MRGEYIMKTNTLVECRGLTKTFPGALALDRVDLTLGRGNNTDKNNEWTYPANSRHSHH